MPKTISLRLSSNSGSPKFSEYFIASLSAEQLLENLSIDFICSSGLHSMTERKIKKTEASFEFKTRSNRLRCGAIPLGKGKVEGFGHE